jgi:hypothetical protein
VGVGESRLSWPMLTMPLLPLPTRPEGLLDCRRHNVLGGGVAACRECGQREREYNAVSPKVQWGLLQCSCSHVWAGARVMVEPLGRMSRTATPLSSEPLPPDKTFSLACAEGYRWLHVKQCCNAQSNGPEVLEVLEAGHVPEPANAHM